MYIYMHIHMYLHAYTHIDIYTYVYIYIYMYIQYLCWAIGALIIFIIGPFGLGKQQPGDRAPRHTPRAPRLVGIRKGTFPKLNHISYESLEGRFRAIHILGYIGGIFGFMYAIRA